MSRTKTILIVEERIVERHTCFDLGLSENLGCSLFVFYCIFMTKFFEPYPLSTPLPPIPQHTFASMVITSMCILYLRCPLNDKRNVTCVTKRVRSKIQLVVFCDCNVACWVKCICNDYYFCQKKMEKAKIKMFTVIYHIKKKSNKYK
jgi:hypothetical protein